MSSVWVLFLPYNLKVWYNTYCNIHSDNSTQWAASLFRQLTTGLSTRRPGVNSKAVNMKFVVHKVEVGQIFSRYFSFPLSVSF